jgi:hypothetical protein
MHICSAFVSTLKNSIFILQHSLAASVQLFCNSLIVLVFHCIKYFAIGYTSALLKKYVVSQIVVKKVPCTWVSVGA